MKKDLKERNEKTQIESSMKLAQNFSYDAKHNQQVVNLSLKLFDELETLHKLGDKEKFWLHNAAILHDIGLIEGPKGHHKATAVLRFQRNGR